jgi:hypothetical protein
MQDSLRNPTFRKTAKGGHPRIPIVSGEQIKDQQRLELTLVTTVKQSLLNLF